MFIASELHMNDVYNRQEVNIRSDQEILMRKIAAGILHMRLSANMLLKSYSCGSICHRVSLQVVKCAWIETKVAANSLRVFIVSVNLSAKECGPDWKYYLFPGKWSSERLWYYEAIDRNARKQRFFGTDSQKTN